MSDWDKQVDRVVNNIKKEINKRVEKAQKAVDREVNKKADKIRRFRKEASRLASMANKRLKRLEKNNLQDSPAYQTWLKESGGKKFGIRGKTYNEVQSEMARMNRFLNAQTSTIRGINNVLKDIADNTGIRYSSLKELRESSKQFFEVASKVEQYLRTVNDSASAIGYQKIWQQINKYVQSAKIDLGNSKNDINRMVSEVTKALNVFDEPIKIDEGGFKGWFKLPKN